MKIADTLPLLGWLFLIGITLLLIGCSGNYVRITEYAAESPIIESATLGGCSVYTSESPLTGTYLIQYTGQTCQVEFTP